MKDYYTISQKPAFTAGKNIWQLFYCDGELPADPATVRSATDPICYNGKMVHPVPVELGELTDLNKVLGLQPKLGREALLVRELECSEDGIAYMGTFADWWSSFHVNGEMMDDTFPEGAKGAVCNQFNHPFPVKLKRGKNVMVFRIRSGLASWFACFGFVPFFPGNGPHETRLYPRKLLMDFILPPSPRLLYGPFLSGMGKNKVAVSFMTDGFMAAGVEYRETGSDTWTRVLDTIDTIPNVTAESHMVHLDGLKEDTAYEYRVLLYPVYRGQTVFIPEEGPFYTFRTFTSAPKEYKALSFGDTQSDYVTMDQACKDLFRVIGNKDDYAFINHLGDTSCNLDNIDQELLNVMNNAVSVPVVFSIGNHEHCGRQAGELHRYFLPEKKTYCAFRHGEVFWINLNMGNDFNNDFGDLNTPMLQAQEAWLREVIRSEECQTAKFRVVVSHHATAFKLERDPETGNFITLHGKDRPSLDAHGRELVEKFFRGKDPLCKIHLWIGGHTHKYLRTYPGEDRFLAMPCPQPGDYCGGTRLDTEMYFTAVASLSTRSNKTKSDTLYALGSIITHVKEDRLEITSLCSDGVVLDQFAIAPDGTVTDLMIHPRVEEFKEKTLVKF